MNTVYERFTATAAQAPEDDFLFVEPVTADAYGIPSGPISWRAAAREVERLRSAYSDAGYGHGHRIGLLLENRPAFIFHWLAANGVGASVVPISMEMRAAELEYLLRHSELCLAVTLPAREDDLQAAARARGCCMRNVRSRRNAPAGGTHPRHFGRPDSWLRRPNVRCSTPRAPPAGPRAVD